MSGAGAGAGAGAGVGEGTGIAAGALLAVDASFVAGTRDEAGSAPAALETPPRSGGGADGQETAARAGGKVYSSPPGAAS